MIASKHTEANEAGPTHSDELTQQLVKLDAPFVVGAATKGPGQGEEEDALQMGGSND